MNFKLKKSTYSLLILLCVIVLGYSDSVESQTRDLVDDMPNILIQLDAFEELFILSPHFDLEGGGLPQRASVMMMERVQSELPDSEEADALLTGYMSNLVVVDNETDILSLLEFRELIAALMLIGTDFQDAFIEFWLNEGIILDGTYTAVQFDIPDSMDIEEPFSAGADFDMDERTNAEEYTDIIICGGTIADYVLASLDHDEDGSCSSGSSVFISCLIESAVQGTPLEEELDTVRSFRDRFLMSNRFGMAVADTYYRFSGWWLRP